MVRLRKFSTLTWCNIQAGNRGSPPDPEIRGSKGMTLAESCVERATCQDLGL